MSSEHTNITEQPDGIDLADPVDRADDADDADNADAIGAAGGSRAAGDAGLVGSAAAAPNASNATAAPNAPDSLAAPALQAVQLTGITFRRGGFTALNDVSWSIPRGGCCAILGPNGAGKSTLLSVITGHEWPTDGETTVLGERYGNVDLSAHRRRIGFVGQSRMPQFVEYQTAFETVLSGRWSTLIVPPHIEVTEADREAARHELAMVGLASRAETQFYRLSSGEQMRLALARALVSRPELLILDEPTAALDLGARANFVGALERLLTVRAGHLTVLLVTHYVEDLPANVKDVLLLREGRVVASGPAAATLNSKNMSRAYGCRVRARRAGPHFTAHAEPTSGWDFD